MTPRKYRITLDMLRMAGRRGNLESCPSNVSMEKVMNAMKTAKYKMQPLYKYVKETENHIVDSLEIKKKKGSASTKFYLTKYLDQEKFKRK